MFFTAFLSLSRLLTTSAGREGGWVISTRAQSGLLSDRQDKKLRRRRLFECLRGTGLFQLTKCFMAVKYDDTARELVH